ncbi:MAG: efflux RND transporter periplasmic adaptor subunit [Chloroflexota bacterium]
MKSKRRIIAGALVIIVLVVVIWWGVAAPARNSSVEIVTSGFIEARDVTVALEVGGRIAGITVDEGDSVAAGAVLVRIDDALLKAQRQQAQAAVALAEAAAQQAAVSRDGAQTAAENALDVQQNPLELDARIIAAEAEVAQASLNLARAQELDAVYPVELAEIRRDTARKVVDNLELFQAQGLVSSYTINRELYPAEGELQAAESNLAYQQQLAQSWTLPAARQRYDSAQMVLENLQAIRENPQEINAAVDRAQAALKTAEAAVAVAQQQLEQARAALGVLDVQMTKLSVSSPLAGMVAGRFAEVGEIAAPGAPLLVITDLSEVTLTAYVPESRIGLVKLGEEVVVSVDSYPGEEFRGRVTYIAPQALFTPKNVQLKEEREKTVFAVKVSLPNPEQKLKPGMPADARILTAGQ